MSESRKSFILSSGFVFDFTHLLPEGQSMAEALSSLQPQLEQAQTAIDHLRQTGEVAGHLSKDGQPEKVYFTQLPFVEEDRINTPASLKRLQEFGQSLCYQTDAVVSFGIGGSFLGNKVLFDVHCGEFWNSQSQVERQGYPEYYFSGQNLDPCRTESLFKHLIGQARRKRDQQGEGAVYRIMLLLISKSGSTIDTMATFMTLYDALQKLSPQIEIQVVAVTDPKPGPEATLLHRLAEEQNWPLFTVPDGIGGRFSAFCEVGLMTGAALGFDIEAFLAGARDMDLACRTSDPLTNPALVNSALKFLAYQKSGLSIEVFMPYSDHLKSLSEWYVQLLAESLGKRLNRQGEVVHYGRTPVVAVGTTDMHAQTQLHQDGPHNKIVQFVQIGQWDQELMIPKVFPGEAKLSALSGLALSDVMNAALEANEQALAQDNRYSARYIMPKLNAYHLGELMYFLALSIAYEGELAQIDAFDQPGVEGYKKILGTLLKNKKSEK